MTTTLLLSRREIASLLDLPALIPVVREAVVALGGEGSSATAGALHWPGGALHVKSGWLAAAGLTTVKANVRPDRGGAAGAIVVLDPGGPSVRAVLDSADITAFRTAAMAGLAVDLLTGPGGLDVAVLGAGPVGRHSLAALAAVRRLTGVRLWSRSSASAQQAAAAAGMPVAVAVDVAEAVRGAGVIVTATPAREAILDPSWVAPGATVIALGADTAGKREVGPGLPAGTQVVVDDADGAAGAGECQWIDRQAFGVTTLTDVATGAVQPPTRRSLTLFDSVGTAVADTAVVAHLLRQAERRGFGTRIALDTES